MRPLGLALKLRKKLTEDGLGGTIASVHSNLRYLGGILISRLGLASKKGFDADHNADTSGTIPIWMLDVKHERIDDCSHYQPSPVEVFERARQSFPENLEDYAFMDVGAGKGRIVMLAAGLPFAKVIGIEISPKLCEAARANLAASNANWRENDRVEIICQDAASVSLPSQDVIIYLYNPFRGSILKAFMERVVESLARSPRRALLVYYHPKDLELIEDTGVFKVADTADDLIVFEYTGDRSRTNAP